MYIKPNNAMKTCGFRASATNEKFKHDSQTQIADAMQSNVCVIYDMVRGYTSIMSSFLGGGWSEYPAPLCFR